MDTGDFIKNNPERARKLKAQWLAFQQKYHPPSFSSEKDLILWSFTNTSVPSGAISGFEIFNYEQSLPTKTPDQSTPPTQTGGSPGISARTLLGLPLLLLASDKPEIMEDDRKYQKIEDEQKKKWLKDNGKKNFLSQEGIDFLYGSPDHPNFETLHDITKKEFRKKHLKETERYDKLALKLHKKPDWDPTVIKTQQEINQHIWAREELEKQKNKKFKELDDATKKKISEQAWDKHIKRFSEKAEAYKETSLDISAALNRKAIRAQVLEDSFRELDGDDYRPRPIQPKETPAENVAAKRAAAIRPVEPTHQIHFNNPPPSGSFPTQRPQPQRKNRGPIGNLNKLPSFFNGLQSLGQAGINATSIVQGFFSKYKWALIGGVILIMFIVTVFTGGSSVDFGSNNGSQQANSGTNPNNAQTCNSGSKGGSLGYTIPIKDTSDLPKNTDQVKQAVLSEWPNAQIQNWDTIVSQSEQNGWDPSFILSLWIEESGAQGASGYTDALGCDPTHPTTDINSSLSCVFNSFKAYSNFDDLMCVYGGDGFHKAPCSFTTENPNFPGNIQKWYTQLTGGSSQNVSLNTTPTACTNNQATNNTAEWPTSGDLTQGPLGAFDHAVYIKNITGHDALDIANPSGPPIYSSFNGTVSDMHDCVQSGDCTLHYGNSVTVTTTDSTRSFSVLYGHLSQFSVSMGQDVKAGDQIGVMGSTGNSTGTHLHWEFIGLPMEPPNIQEPISPLDCDTPSIPCSPASITAGSPGV